METRQIFETLLAEDIAKIKSSNHFMHVDHKKKVMSIDSSDAGLKDWPEKIEVEDKQGGKHVFLRPAQPNRDREGEVVSVDYKLQGKGGWKLTIYND